jgi:hypothetical protein
MTMLEFKSRGRVMLRDLGRVDQFTNPPVTAITMLPIAQLIVLVEAIVISVDRKVE